MGHQVIPEAAVEAALDASLTFKNQRGMDNAANLMRHILEAAAPRLMAGAWDEGAAATDDYERKYRVAFDFGDDLPEPPANPYRTAK